MGKLGSHARQNALATTPQETGNIGKTIFILDYITIESLRHRIQRGINKGEAMNYLARAIFLGKREELRERKLQDQLQRSSSLNILINSIIIWNTTYLQKSINHKKKSINFMKNYSNTYLHLIGNILIFLVIILWYKNVLKSNQLKPLNTRNL